MECTLRVNFVLSALPIGQRNSGRSHQSPVDKNRSESATEEDDREGHTFGSFVLPVRRLKAFIANGHLVRTLPDCWVSVRCPSDRAGPAGSM
uniref:Uncharacterized protein n=1 Tax=Anguilla anguilla TaxID=7936 RepID=A0A0E9WJH4_ANGAN